MSNILTPWVIIGGVVVFVLVVIPVIASTFLRARCYFRDC